MALKTKFAPFLMSVSRKVAGAGEGAGGGARSGSAGGPAGARGSPGPRAARAQGPRRARRAGGRGYVVLGELFCVGLYGWLEFRNTVYTLSTLLNFSKNGIKSNSSESVMSSNHDATGTWETKNGSVYSTFFIRNRPATVNPISLNLYETSLY